MTSKRETHRQDLRPLLLAALNSPGLLPPAQFNMARFSLDPRVRAHLIDPDITALEDYLIDHSHLPGRRANLELVWALADDVGELCAAPDVSLNHSYVAMEWLLWELMNRYPPAVFGRDPDSPLQMPQLCGAVAFGEWAAVFQHIEAGVSALLQWADSPLWRVREGVAMGLQRMLAAQWSSTIRRLRRRVLDAMPYEWRAVVAGIAEPDLLTDANRALDALDLHIRRAGLPAPPLHGGPYHGPRADSPAGAGLLSECGRGSHAGGRVRADARLGRVERSRCDVGPARESEEEAA
jgi:hypothetical protein